MDQQLFIPCSHFELHGLELIGAKQYGDWKDHKIGGFELDYKDQLGTNRDVSVKADGGAMFYEMSSWKPTQTSCRRSAR